MDKFFSLLIISIMYTNIWSMPQQIDKPIEIYDCEQLITQIPRNLGGHFIIKKDIDCRGRTITSFGSKTAGAFFGIFDGNQKTISNFIITGNEDDIGLGLFAYVADAVIKNITLKNILIKGSSKHIGALVGLGIWRVSIKNSFVIDSRIESLREPGRRYFAYVGGMAGHLWHENIVEHVGVSNVTVVGAGDDSVGGLVGYLGNNSKISYSYSDGVVSGHDITGGLVAIARGKALIESSFSTATVSVESHGVYMRVGGLIGELNSASLKHCYATGRVTGHNVTFIAGLVGSTVDSGKSNIDYCYAVGLIDSRSNYRSGGLLAAGLDETITNSYWDVNTTKQNTSAGVSDEYGKTTEEMKNISTYKGWPFNGKQPIWAIDPTRNDGYPYLLGVSNEYKD